ncbi:hypothetical protein [Streptomyces sp. S1D4-20]|uniref:hypothetical protein n=1 Tax=Streptomyces sp. S1D4-20 TaxID=2594462 RepID=UPI001161E533|nr:hypothetical protein [Streptomyces sp. S1D4-20]QDN54060.1 hypothetical protein FNV67_00325 [Streptomyces sp. S1D4-20]
MPVSLLGRRTTVKAGDTVLMRIGYSEVAVHMRVAGKLMPVRITTGGRYPMAQILGDYAHPFGGAITLGEAGLYTDSEGTIYSDAIVATHVAWAPTATPGGFYVFTDEGRVPNAFPLFEEARDDARRIGGEVRHADNRYTPPFWTRFTPVSLDAKVTRRYEAQGRNDESRATLTSEKYTDFTTDEQAIDAAMQLAAGWGHAQAARDAHVLDDTGIEPYLFGGRKILWKG